MIKIGQIIDKETKGLNYLETSRGELVGITQVSGTQEFTIELVDFDELDNPIAYIEERELTLDLNTLEGKSIREALTELI